MQDVIDDGARQLHGVHVESMTIPASVKGLEPFGARLVVQPIKIELSGGLELPDQIAYTNNKGVVVAAGPGRYADQTGAFIPTRAEVGQVVLFSEFASTKVVLGAGAEAVNLLLVDDTNVIGVLHGDPNEISSDVREVTQQHWQEAKVSMLRDGLERDRAERPKGTLYSLPSNGVPVGKNGLVVP